MKLNEQNELKCQTLHLKLIRNCKHYDEITTNKEPPDLDLDEIKGTLTN